MKEQINWNETKEVLPVEQELSNAFNLLVQVSDGYISQARYNIPCKIFQNLHFMEIKDVERWAWMPRGKK